MITVGQEIITAKRNLSDIFPPELTNRRIFNEYIQYILNNYFEKSKEKSVSSYVGCVVESVDGTETYLKEPTAERQLNQIIPVLKSGDNKITFNNYMADLHNEGCTIYDQNKLLSSKFWSWCPPINVDAFINYMNYVWIGYPYEEDDIKIFNAEINVKDEFIDKRNNVYREYDEEGAETYSYTMQDGDIVCFPNDTSNTYNTKPFKVKIVRTPDESRILSISFVSLSVPLIIIAAETNISVDVIGKKYYTFKDVKRDYQFDLVNGMRIRFLNDANTECNNISYIVQGVGEYINFVEDSYNPYQDADSHSTKDSIIFKPDYFVMERGSIDGNDWSRLNRWVQRKALEAMNISSMGNAASDGALNKARRPIICFNKDIELFNSGSFDRGIVKYALNMKSGEINGTSVADWYSRNIQFNTGDHLLLLGNVGSSAYQLYSVRVVDSIVYLDILLNGQTEDGSSIKGDTVKVNFGSNAGNVFYYNGYEWITGQVKSKLNQMPLFNLYDTDKVALNNAVTYPNSTFNGCTLFQYEESDIINPDKDVEVSIVIDEKDSTNIYFENTLTTDKFYFTPPNNYEQEITGYRLYRNIKTDSYLNDWYLSSVSSDQYLKTRIEVYDNGDEYPFVYIDKSSYDDYLNGESNDYIIYTPKNKDNLKSYIEKMESMSKLKEVFKVYVLNLKYTPKDLDNRKTLIITNNDLEMSKSDVIKDIKSDKKYYLKNVDIGDVLIIKMLPNDVNGVLDENYSYEYPLSLTVNQFNKDIDVIGYNDCFNQMVSIISSQADLQGSPIGSNNYSSINPDVSVGTKIVQTPSSVIRSMVLNDNANTSIRASILYAQNSYSKFKRKFINLIEQENIKGNIIDNEDAYNELELNPSSMDDMIISVINKINIGKEGLLPFYNNGVLTILDNAYIPSTPAYLGVANCYEPRIEEWKGYTLDIKPSVIVGHDGSLTRATHSVKDLYLLRLETLIYQSIENKFKDTRCGLNIYPYMPGKFRENTYTRQEVLDAYSPMFESWCTDANITYTDNDKFTYDNFDVEPNCWKTWNYTGCLDNDGEPLYGSYRSVYMYYYDTYRPDTHPWEMLGFGEKPSWWQEEYGEEPYTSENIIMWKDIENGIIKKGPYAGEYNELKRPGLFENYLPVDEEGKLKNPVDANIIPDIPTIQQARKKWTIGDIGDVEFAYLQTSESKFAKELVKYMLRPVDWVETNWNTLDREVLFQGTEYEQIIDSLTNTREDISKMVMHNELINNNYVRKIGIQQWISDYLTSNTISISNTANAIRESDVCLGYRCSGFYQKDTVEIITDTYGVLPTENVHINLINSKRERIFTYSGMSITRSKKGYVIDGFDISDPYFKVRMPETTGKKSTIDANGKTFYYYHHYKDEVTKIPYRKEFATMQEVYDVINGYGKYLTENENWYFSTLAPDGTVLDFRSSSESFAFWATSLKGPDSENALLLINPGSLGIGNYNDGLVSNMGSKISGFATIRDIYGNPVESNEMDVYRQAFNTYFSPKDVNIALVKFKTYDLEHLITFDNVTIYNDIIYNSVYSAQMERFKIYGIKVLNWYGTLYAPGYIVRDEGAIPNYDKTVNDLQYIFDVDDVHCVGEYAKYSKGIVGYRTTKTYKDLYKNEKSMFDFYKGAIQHKGTKGVLAKMNRSSNISSTGNNIELYEIWGFREGKFGHIKDNSVDEFILDTSKMIQNPQIITFETATDYYFDNNITYNIGDICIYNNYEYVAIKNNILGKFNSDDWKKIRYVGNYIIFEGDKKWIKKSNTPKVNCFKYTDNLLINPIGGFAKTTECSYIVPTEEDAMKMLDSIELGDTVWIVKTKLGDWDVRKKTGISKYVSMRYFNIKDAMKQPDEIFVYHFTDDNMNYYATNTSDTIKVQDIVYEDADINNISCKWGDIGIPEYTGEESTYITGTDYKVKLYNTVFLTQSQQSQLNNGTPLQDIYTNTPVSYSDLLLNMTQFGHNTYTFKWKFKLHVTTIAKDVKIVINGTTYNKNTVELLVCEGDIINWKVSAYGCGERKGTTYVKRVDEAVYNMTKAQIDALSDANKKRYNLKQELNLDIPLSYRRNTIIYQANAGRNTQNIILEEGYYDIEFVGAGGGAGGATSCGYDHHRHPGCSGAGGAYLHANLNIKTPSSNNIKYTITTGKGGAGGAPGHHKGKIGLNGGDTVLALNGSAIVYGQGGAGGMPSRTYANDENYFKCSSRVCGYGGKLQPDVENNNFELVKYSDSRNGNNGGLGQYGGQDALSVYPVGNYGRGGLGVNKTYGNPGFDGYGKVVFKDKDGYDEYTSYDKSFVSYISIANGESDSMDYSAYYQPYVIKPNTDGSINYFYSYDVLYDDELRPDAKIVSDASSFYKNRSRSISAYHNTNIIKNEWKSNAPYHIGDKVTVNKGEGNSTLYKYFICVKDNQQSTFAETNGQSGDKLVVYWEEYAPTYYYKITYNKGKNDSATKPTYNNGEYRLYEDAECTIPVELESSPYYMKCSDLQLDTANVGNTYTLVDKFATYSQITPKYLSEPSWSQINQVGTYQITSGNIPYYVNSDKVTIEGDKESLVYSNEICTIPVKTIKPKLSNSGLTYEEVSMKYTDIINTVIEHREPSYELRDNETYLYTSKPQNELTDDTPVYNEFELEEQRGVYKDYIPTWEKTTDLPNGYTNTLKYVKYDETEISRDSSVKTYTCIMKDSNNNERDFFWDDDGTKKFFYTPSKVEEDGTLDHEGINLYTLNKYVVETHDDLNDLTASNNDICRVLIDKTTSNNVSVTNLRNVYYKKTSSGWQLLGTFYEINTEDSYFKQYEDDIYVQTLENTSVLYPELSYNRDSISNSDYVENNGINNTVKLYFNKQSVGKYITTNTIVSDKGKTEKLRFFTFKNEDDTINDAMYVFVSSMYDKHSSDSSKTSKQLYNEVFAEQYSGKVGYIDESEAIYIYEYALEERSVSKYFNENRFIEHVCESYDMYRNDDGNIKYINVCLFGDKFYAKTLVLEPVTNETANIGVLYGTMEDISTYSKINYNYVPSKLYNVGDVCSYENNNYECIKETNSNNFNPTDWKLYSKDKIVNVITYKSLNDIIYITSDNFGNSVIDNIPVLSDTNGYARENGSYALEGKNGWMKMIYIKQDYMFDLIGCERKRLNVDAIKSCYLVDNRNDDSIVQVQVFDPIQNIIPNSVTNEINYISSTDPVNDYSDTGRWSDNKVGFLWWDTSKVRYIDYYQGDYEYRRDNWGKQLPGSEIAIMEWTKSVSKPDETDMYVERSSFNYETSTIETYYYYWKKNPISVPEVSFRTTSAYHIAEIINDPTKQGIIWMSPIDSGVSGKNDNTLIITNFSNVMTGQEAVLQLNTDSDKEIMDHTEWVEVKENTNDDIPEWLWEKMRDSLLGYKTISGVDMPVPDPLLRGRQRLGIAFRPRQTMFDSMYNARRNFIDALNDIFRTRTEEQMMIDLNSGLDENIDSPYDSPYYDAEKTDEAGTMLELMSWKDENLIGQNILVRHDETHDNIWAIYHVNRGFTYSMIDYQKYSIKNYLYYEDWYLNDSIKYLTPVYTEKTSELTARKIASGDLSIPGAKRYIKEGEIVKYEDDNEWKLYQNINGTAEIVGVSNSIMQIDESIYDYVNENIDDTEPYIELYKENDDETYSLDKTLTKYEYVYDETQELLKRLIDYVDVEADA